MNPRVEWLEPQPAAHERPEHLASPFDEAPPHPLALRAAQSLQASLRAGELASGLPSSLLETTAGGKMFGVLVVEGPEGRVGLLQAFSGMLAGRWDVEGFAPPLFHRAARERIEGPGEAVVKSLLARAAALKIAPERLELERSHRALLERHAAERARQKAQHELRRRQRHVTRDGLRALGDRAAELHALDQESRRDKAERRELEARQEKERAAVEPLLRRSDRRLGALERLRRIVSRSLMRQLFDTYVLTNARGEEKRLRALYPRGEPPSGAGDCAGAKLLAAAARLGLRPLALGEFWWGAPPLAGGRLSGSWYPACRDKCGPLLPFLLEGVPVAKTRAFTPAATSSPLPIVYEDAWIIVVEKPSGLLSVPAKDATITDSVLARLRARSGKAIQLAHRLDLDTSGLLVAARDAATHLNLQRQFLTREVEKRYIAWIDGPVEGARGSISLPLRVDLEDRPRQIHDPLHGKAALTEWEVLDRTATRTRVALFPRTGRTHQLRVHAAHPAGLGAPIVGDRLYGREAERLLLHAETLVFNHPKSGERISFYRPAPF